MALELRLAREDELTEAGRITVEGYRTDGLLDDEPDYEHRLADAAARAADAELWVALEDGRLVGVVTFCRPGTPYSELADEHEGEFRMLAVAPAGRRRGVARALVQTCIARSRELGYVAVVLSSMAQMTAAHRLYEDLGFARVPTRDWSPVPQVPLLAYRLPLT